MDEHQGRGPSRSTAPLVAALALLALVLVILAAAATGPWHRTPMGGGGSYGTGNPQPTLSLPSQSPVSPIPTPDLSEPDGESPVLRWVLLILAAVVTVAVVLLVLRLLQALSRHRTEPLDARMTAAAVPEPEIDAPELREGIDRARSILDSDRPPRDAIVEAWVALEQSAERAGVGRRASQTPTEFTAVVLARTPADHDAVEVLRALYSHVRFSAGEVDAAEGDAARAALAAIARSWAGLRADR